MKQEYTSQAELINGDLRVRVEAGELRSFRRGDREYMHDPSEPGWGHSDTEMFPVIGPTAEAAYRVQVPRGNAIQDQHGLLRELAYSCTVREKDRAVFVREYTAGTPVANSKYPGRSTARLLIWPYSFRVEKHFQLGPGSLEITFRVEGEKDMPYMFGYHPAFRLGGEGSLEACGREFELSEILAAGDRALEVPACDTVFLGGDTPLRIHTAGFGNFMLWSPDPGMVCVEPITYYPYTHGPARLHEGFRFLDSKKAEFSVRLQPAG